MHPSLLNLPFIIIQMDNFLHFIKTEILVLMVELKVLMSNVLPHLLLLNLLFLLIIHAKFSFLKMTQIIGLLKYHLLILFITTLHTTNIHIIFIISYLILLPNGTKLLKYPIHIEVNLKTGKNQIITHPLKLLKLLLI